MQYQLCLLLAMAPLLCAAFDESIFENETVRPYAKYDVTVLKGSTIWFGVIITKYFVLSADHFKDPKQYKPKELKISTDRYANNLNVEEVIRNAQTKYHQVEKTWVFESLLIMRIKFEIHFDTNVHSITLPNKALTSAWKNPCNIPNNKRYSTTYWCAVKPCTIYSVTVTTVTRKCSKGQVCPKEKLLVPSCFSIKTPGYKCTFMAGAPLVYNNTLVGIRKYTASVDPYSDYYEDDFINVSAYMEIINNIVSGELKCYARN